MRNTAFGWAVPALVAAQLLQTTAFAHLRLAGSYAQLPLLVVLCVALLGGVQRGAWAGAGAGLLTGYGLGWHTGSLVVASVLVAALFGLFPRRFEHSSPLAPPLCAFAATLLFDATLAVMAPNEFPLRWWAHHALAAGAFNAVLVWPVHGLLTRLCLPPARPMFP